MKILTVISNFFKVVFLFLIFTNTLFGQQSITLNSLSAQYETGRVDWYNKLDMEIKVGTSTANGFKGWVRWPITSIPSNATILSLDIRFYVRDPSSSNSFILDFEQMTWDPKMASRSQIWNDIGSNTEYSWLNIGTGSDYFLHDLGSQAVNDLQLRINSGGSDYWWIGFEEYEMNDNRCEIDGYNWGEPQLIVYYEIENTPEFYNVNIENGIDNNNNGFYEQWDFEVDIDASNGGIAEDVYIYVTAQGNSWEFGPFNFEGTATWDNQVIGPFYMDDFNISYPQDIEFHLYAYNLHGDDNYYLDVPVDVEEPEPELYVDPTDIDLGTYPSGHSISESFIVKNIGGGTLTGNISESVNWITYLSQSSFSLGSNQQVTINFSGSFPSTTGSFSTNISVTSNGGNEQVYVHGIVEDPIGIFESYLFRVIKVYPNPANTNYIFIEFEDYLNSDVNLSIINVYGKLIYKTILPKSEKKHKINISEFQAGVYLIKLQTPKGTITKKITLIH